MRSKSQSQGNKPKVAVEKSCSQPSSSTSSSKKKVTKPTAAVKGNKPDDPRPPQKKTKTDYSSSPDEVQIIFNEIMLNNLPQNVLKIILGLLTTPTLLAARLANQKFNEISCKILCSRPKAKFEFFVSSNEFFYYAKTGTRNLKDFIACFKKSKIVPFSNFSFCFEDSPIQPKSFDRREWLDFLSLFGDPNSKMTIKCLRLFIRHVGDRSNLVIFLGYLRDLLLNKIKTLEEFGLDISPQDGVEMDASKINLFPSSSSSEPKTSSIQLPHLKFLHLGNSLSEEYPGIVGDLLKVAVNLKKIQVLPEYEEEKIGNLTASSFQLLQSQGKIHCLEETEIYLTDKFLKVIKDQIKDGAAAGVTQMEISPPEFVQNFKLKKLSLNMVLDVTTHESESGVITTFISNVLSSSKNTLKSLSFEPLGFFQNLELPTFTNLKELGFISNIGAWSGGSFPFLPCGVRSRNIFPAVQLLDLTHMENGDWCSYFSQLDSIPRLPNVKTLNLVDQNLKSNNAILNISLMFINLKELKISRKEGKPTKINFLQVVRAIWTDMRQLESLEIDVDVDSGENSTSDLDSCFTGFSTESLQRLHEVMNAVKTFEKWGVEIPKSDPTVGLERKFASILEMKDLRRLIINPYSGVKLLDRKCFFKEKLTWISEKYAFKLMPQLHIEN